MRDSLQLGSATGAGSGNEFVLVSRHSMPKDEAIKVLSRVGNLMEFDWELIGG